MFRTLRFHFRLISAFINKYWGVLVVGFGMGILTFWLIPKYWTMFSKIGLTTRIAMVGKYTISDIPLSIQSKISFGLTKTSDSNLAIPGIAKDWSVSLDGKIYIFNLRDDLYWHDGTRLVASDLNYSFRDAKIDYPSQNTVVVTLSDSYTPLPTTLARPAFKTGLVGVGLSKVTKIKYNGVYLSELSLSDGTIYKFYVSQTQAKIAFKLGEVDTLVDLIPGDELEKWPNVITTPVVHTDRIVSLFFNTTQIDKPSRQALTYALDKKRWNPRVYSPISRLSWAYNPDVKQYDYDPQKITVAKKMAEVSISTLSAYKDVAEMIKSDWEKLGLKITIEVVDSIPEQFETLVLVQAIPIDPDQYHLWHSTQQSNITRLDDKRIDKILEDGRRISDQTKRLALYKDFQKYLLEDLPAIFLYYQTTNTLTRK